MRRREFITFLGGVAVGGALLPSHAARAQERARPVIGILTGGVTGPSSFGSEPAFIQALAEHGLFEGRTIEFDFRWGPWEQMPALASELVRRRVAVIRAGGPPAVRAAMEVTKTIPIVFGIGEDPVKERLVASLARPGGNVTGFAGMYNELVAKRVELLRELVPQARARLSGQSEQSQHGAGYRRGPGRR